MAQASARELIHRANACADRNDVEGSAAALAEFLKRHRAHAAAGQVRLRYAQTLVRLGRYAEGITQLKRLVRAEPGSMDARDSLALAYQIAGRLDEALAAVEDALRLDPDHAEAIARKAILLMYAGEPARAAAVIDEAVSRGVHACMPELAFAGVAPRVGRVPEAIARLRTLLDSGGLAPPERAQTLLELARLLERVGEDDDAWAAASEAQSLRPTRFDPDTFDRRAEDMLASLTPEALAGLPAPVDPGEDVVLIVGSPRSGTTLVEGVLAAHPDCVTAGETPGFERAAEALGVTNDPSAWRPEQVRRSEVVGASGRLLTDLRARAGRGARRIDKQPANWWHVGLASALTPGARVIQVHRDPRDTAVSLYFRYFSAGHDFASRLDWIGRYLRTCARVMRHWSERCRDGRLGITLTDVRYETLVEQTEREGRRLVGALDLPWDDACLAFHERRAITPTLTPEQAGAPVYGSSLARWRRYEQHLGPLMDALGDEAPAHEPPARG